MKEYNSAFFGLYENWFKILKNEYGEDKALALFRQSMEMGLKKAYGNDFEKGQPKEFVRLVGARDNNVGLLVQFPEISDKKLVYQFHTDPFPNLKNLVDFTQLDDTYISFKVEYILGAQWSYANTRHLWKGDAFTEYVIINNANDEYDAT